MDWVVCTGLPKELDTLELHTKEFGCTIANSTRQLWNSSTLQNVEEREVYQTTFRIFPEVEWRHRENSYRISTDAYFFS
jgi:hypothetical protein